MPEPLYPPAFEETVRAALSVPEPDPAFMTSLRKQFLSRPTKETNMKPRTTRPFPRLAWGLALLFILVLVIAALASSPEVVNAMRRLLGYIPGVGVVEQTTTLRVLAEPVTQSREGVTLTIEQAAATADQTYVVFYYVQGESFVERPAREGEISGDPHLRLPDGSELKIVLGHRLGADPQDPPGASLRYRMEFGPLPQGVNHAVLLLPQLIPMQPGVGPENWEIPIDFRASTGGEGLPVMEIVPSPTVLPENTVPVPASPTPDLTHGILFTLDKVVMLPDGYILMSSARWNVTVPGDTGWYDMSPAAVTITDANGQVVSFDDAQSEENPAPGLVPLAYHIKAQDVFWPVTIKADPMSGSIDFGPSVESQLAFEFDPGPGPQPGQTWPLDQNFQVNGYDLHVSSVQLIDNPVDNNHIYEFTMDSTDSSIAGVFLSDLDRLNQQAGGGGGVPDPGPFIAKLYYENNTPPHVIRVGINGLSFVFHGSWQFTWSPPGQ